MEKKALAKKKVGKKVEKEAKKKTKQLSLLSFYTKKDKWTPLHTV